MMASKVDPHPDPGNNNKLANPGPGPQFLARKRVKNLFDSPAGFD
jgi:hypothetical protein